MDIKTINPDDHSDAHPFTAPIESSSSEINVIGPAANGQISSVTDISSKFLTYPNPDSSSITNKIGKQESIKLTFATEEDIERIKQLFLSDSTSLSLKDIKIIQVTADHEVIELTDSHSPEDFKKEFQETDTAYVIDNFIIADSHFFARHPKLLIRNASNELEPFKGWQGLIIPSDLFQEIHLHISNWIAKKNELNSSKDLKLASTAAPERYIKRNLLKDPSLALNSLPLHYILKKNPYSFPILVQKFLEKMQALAKIYVQLRKLEKEKKKLEKTRSEEAHYEKQDILKTEAKNTGIQKAAATDQGIKTAIDTSKVDKQRSKGIKTHQQIQRAENKRQGQHPSSPGPHIPSPT